MFCKRDTFISNLLFVNQNYDFSLETQFDSVFSVCFLSPVRPGYKLPLPSIA